MLLKDAGYDIFTQMESSFPGLKLFTLANGDYLDTMLAAMHGLKSLIPNAESSENVAKLAATLYGEKWDSAYEIFNASYALAPVFGDKYRNALSSSRLYGSSYNDVEKISAYNASEFADDSSKIESKNDSTVENSVEEKIHSNLANYKLSFEVLQKNYIDGIVFKDVLSLITSNVYNLEDALNES